MSYQQNKQINQLEKEYEKMTELIHLLNKPDVNAVDLNKFGLSPDSTLLEKYIKDKDLDIVGNTIRKVDKLQSLKRKIQSTEDKIQTVKKQINGLTEEGERLSKELDQLQTDKKQLEVPKNGQK